MNLAVQALLDRVRRGCPRLPVAEKKKGKKFFFEKKTKKLLLRFARC